MIIGGSVASTEPAITIPYCTELGLPVMLPMTVASPTGDIAMPAHPNAALETPTTLSVPDLNAQGAAIRKEFAAPGSTSPG